MEVKELGHIVLYVRDVRRSAAFYHGVLGWKVAIPVTQGSPVAAFSSGRTHHELLLIEVGDNALPQPQGRHVGLYHVGLKIGETDLELREASEHLDRLGVPITGASDHTVSHSLYVRDPDGNQIELFVDVPDVDWKSNPSLIASPIRPLDL